MFWGTLPLFVVFLVMEKENVWSIYIRPWCSTPHRPRNKGASSYEWKLLILWTKYNHLPCKLFLTSICHGDKNICPKSLYNFMFFPSPQIITSLRRVQVWFGEPGEQQDRDVCSSAHCVNSAVFSQHPQKKKARVLGSGTTAGEQIICCKPWEKDALDFLAIPCGIYKFHCCSQ